MNLIVSLEDERLVEEPCRCTKIMMNVYCPVHGPTAASDRLFRASLRLALRELDEARARECRIKSAWALANNAPNQRIRNEAFEEVEAALSSSAPCGHAEDLFHARQAVLTEGLARIDAEVEAKRLREAVEWACGRLTQPDENELRRRAGQP